MPCAIRPDRAAGCGSALSAEREARIEARIEILRSPAGARREALIASTDEEIEEELEENVAV